MTRPVPHPAEALRDAIKPSGLAIAEAADRLAVSHDVLSAVLDGQAAIDADLALRMESAGLGAAYVWLKMQLRHDLAQARQRPPTAVQPFPNTDRPKSYMTDEERDERLAGGMSENGILLAESHTAGRAGDEEASWAWLALAELPAHSLAFLKDQQGAVFIRSRGFQTKNADAAYGSGWLER
jgi:addiction module HigA family antidote